MIFKKKTRPPVDVYIGVEHPPFVADLCEKTLGFPHRCRPLQLTPGYHVAFRDPWTWLGIRYGHWREHRGFMQFFVAKVVTIAKFQGETCQSRHCWSSIVNEAAKFLWLVNLLYPIPSVVANS